MDKFELKKKWNELKWEAKKKWNDLTDKDLQEIEGDWEKLLEKIEQRCEFTRQQALKEIEGWEYRKKRMWASEEKSEKKKKAG